MLMVMVMVLLLPVELLGVLPCTCALLLTAGPRCCLPCH